MRKPSIIILFFLIAFSSFSQITINFPLSRSVFQRDNKNTSTIYISGNYEDVLEKIEARLVPIKQGQGTAVDWTTIIDKPEGGTFVGNIKGTGGWYQLQLRGWKNGAIVSQPSVDKVGIGEVFLIAGQSNAEGKRNFGEIASTDDRVNCFDYQKIDFLDEIPPYKSFSHLEATSSIAPRGQGAWCWGELGDLLAQRLNVPILFFNSAYEGTTLENWYSSSIGVTTTHPFFKYTFPNQTPYSYMRISLQYYISQLGLRSVLWCQGEAELDAKTTEDYYVTNLKKVIDKSRADCGKKISWVIARTTLTNYTQTNPAIIRAQNRLINTADNIYEGPYTDSIQVPRPEGVHFQNLSNNTGITNLAKAWDKKLSNNFFTQSVPFLSSPIITIKATCATLENVTLGFPTSYSFQKWSNNSSNPTITAQSGTFSSLVRDATGNYYFTNNVDVKKVFPTKIPLIYAKGGPSFCDGTSVDLFTDNTDYPSFLWNSGETSKQITVKTSNRYTLRGVSSVGCGSPESSAINTQVLALPPKPTIFISPSNIVCEGTNVILASSNPKENTWSTNDIAQAINIQKVGDYAITVKTKDENGCVSPISDIMKVSIRTRPETPEISQIGAFTLQAKQKTLVNDIIFEWRSDGKTVLNKTGIIKAVKPAFYTVLATQNFIVLNNQTLTCRSNLSGAFSFIPDVNIKKVIIYPNPTTDGKVTLEAQADLADLTLIVYSLRGQYIYSTSVAALTERRLVDLSFLEEGKYIIKLMNSTFVETKYIWVERK